MFKPIPVSIGLRYLRAKRRNGFISFISMASILGIALGVTVLITTLAVMSGFQKEIRDRLLQMTAHTTITADGAPMADWAHAVEVAKKDPRVAGAAPYIEIQAMLSGPRVQGAIVQGIDPALEPNVSVINQKVKKGSFDSLTAGSYNLLVGQELAIDPARNRARTRRDRTGGRWRAGDVRRRHPGPRRHGAVAVLARCDRPVDRDRPEP